MPATLRHYRACAGLKPNSSAIGREERQKRRLIGFVSDTIARISPRGGSYLRAASAKRAPPARKKHQDMSGQPRSPGISGINAPGTWEAVASIPLGRTLHASAWGRQAPRLADASNAPDLVWRFGRSRQRGTWPTPPVAGTRLVSEECATIVNSLQNWHRADRRYFVATRIPASSS
jgi:hypothetical protein